MSRGPEISEFLTPLAPSADYACIKVNTATLVEVMLLHRKLGRHHQSRGHPVNPLSNRSPPNADSPEHI